MSLILDALKKVEKDRAQPERGFLVLGHMPWASGPRRRLWPWILALVLAVAGLAFGLREAFVGKSPIEAPPTVSRPSTPAATAPVAPRASPSEASTSPSSPRNSRANALPEAAAALPAQGAPADGRWPRLLAVSIRDGRPVALLGERLYHEGESFDGIEVLRIGTSEVEVRAGAIRKTLRFE